MPERRDDERGPSEDTNAHRPRRRARRQAERSRRKLARKALAAGAAAAGVAAIAAPADAATFTVINLNDSGAGSLRQAIDDANTAAGADIVDFQAGLTGTILLTTGQLSIEDSVDVQGPGPSALTVSGNNASRVFYLYNASALIDVTISGLTVTAGNAGYGGGIADYGENLTLTNMVVTGNSAGALGGGIAFDAQTLGPGVFEGTLTIVDSVISGNTTDGDGGGIYIEDTGGPLLIQNSRIVGNVAGRGGGIYLYDPDYDITIVDSTIAGNTATFGGGIALYSTDAGSFTISRTTISDNEAIEGGGLFVYGVDQPLRIENTTISGNEATLTSGGGAFFYAVYPGTATIAHSTIAANTAYGGGGGVYLLDYNGTVALDHTIVGDNTATQDPDLCGQGTYGVRFTLIETPAAANITDNGGNILNQDPQLGPLADNGGPTETHLPAAASPVINAGDPAFTPPPSTDQRALPRVDDGRIDMGAVELAVAVPGTLQFSISGYTVNENGVTATITVTRVGGSDGAVSVAFATSNGTATQPADYLTAAGTLDWADGDAAPKTFQVTIVDDPAVEGDETVNLTLSNPQGGAALGSPATALLTIVDNDIINITEIPTLDEWGRLLLAGLLAAGGLLALRRRRDLAGPTLVLALAVGAGAVAADPASHAQGGGQGQRQRPGKQEAVLAEQKGRATVVRLPDGSTIDLATVEVKVKDQRPPRARHSKALPTDLGALLAEPGVHVFVRSARNGKPPRVVVVVGEREAKRPESEAKPRN